MSKLWFLKYAGASLAGAAVATTVTISALPTNDSKKFISSEKVPRFELTDGAEEMSNETNGENKTFIPVDPLDPDAQADRTLETLKNTTWPQKDVSMFGFLGEVGETVREDTNGYNWACILVDVSTEYRGWIFKIVSIESGIDQRITIDVSTATHPENIKRITAEIDPSL